MVTSCNRWVSLSSAGALRHRHRDPTIYLQFLRTGLLVGLPDEPGVLIDDDRDPRDLLMLETDAAGLGIDREDLADGVALCRGDGSFTGWRCTHLNLLIGEPAALEFEPSKPIYRSAARARDSAKISATSAPTEIPAHPRMLLFVTPDRMHDGWLALAADLARARAGTVVLGAVGELPESSLHAAEERHALTAMLDGAASYFADVLAGLRIELGGDPIHGLVTLAEEVGADLIVLPGEPGHAGRMNGLGHALEMRGLTVMHLMPPPLVTPPQVIVKPTPRRDGASVRDGGWVELLGTGGGSAIAHAHLVKERVPAELGALIAAIEGEHQHAGRTTALLYSLAQQLASVHYCDVCGRPIVDLDVFDHALMVFYGAAESIGKRLAQALRGAGLETGDTLSPNYCSYHGQITSE